VNPWPRLKERWRAGVLPVGRALGRIGLTPNALTALGLVLNIAAGVILATGAYQWGGLAYLAASAFDSLDGAVARAMGQTSRFGAFFDSLADRYSESAVLLGLAWGLTLSGQWTLVAAVGATLVGSLMVSYARARAEGLGVDCEIGLLQRTERILVLGVGLLFAELLLAPVLLALAVATNVTVVQRVLHVRRALAVERSG
jgi:CDP-diacylglycerol--glycerol-3-phosphate 3-phosphatidyltransferase